MARRSGFAVLPLLLLLLSLTACQRPNEPSSEGPVTYDLVGIVREVAPADHSVTIRHEAIPGFMAAMTMPFTVDDDDLLAELHPGDEVAGKLDVVRRNGQVQTYRLASLIVTRPALAEPPPPTANRLRPGDELPDFQITLQDGSTARLADLRGQWVALTFIYTRCPLPDFCPMLDRKFAELRRRLDQSADVSGSVRLVSISFDPDHDTPEILERHARQVGARPPGWMFAVASHDELGRIAPGLGLSYAPGDREIIHNLITALIDPAGKVARIDRGRDWQPSDLIRTVRRAARTADEQPDR